MTTVTETSVPPRITLRHISEKTDLQKFACGVDEIDRWAREKAFKFHTTGRARVTAAWPEGSSSVCGFYSLTHSVAETSKLLRNEDRDKWDNAPIVYIKYLGVLRSKQRCGIGSMMLIDALRNAYTIHKIAPLYGVGLRALNGDAARLYEKNGFRRAPKEDGPHPLMILPIWTIEDLFKPRK